MLNWLKKTISDFVDWLKSTWTDFVDWIRDTITTLVKFVSDLVVNIFKAIWDMATDLVCWVLDKLLDLVVSAVKALDLSGLQGFAPAGGLPAEILNVMALCGVGSAVAIITTAIGIRIALQLIPFTRLGS
ncbi:DUF2523 family protein [Delftia sp. WSY_7]|uniref:DUF2523 family protein n=1 Tax=Delftia sp. WSY_7 TaxID=3367202 RepID=UPI00370CB370